MHHITFAFTRTGFECERSSETEIICAYVRRSPTQKPFSQLMLLIHCQLLWLNVQSDNFSTILWREFKGVPILHSINDYFRLESSSDRLFQCGRLISVTPLTHWTIIKSHLNKLPCAIISEEATYIVPNTIAGKRLKVQRRCVRCSLSGYSTRNVWWCAGCRLISALICRVFPSSER